MFEEGTSVHLFLLLFAAKALVQAVLLLHYFVLSDFLSLNSNSYIFIGCTCTIKQLLMLLIKYLNKGTIMFNIVCMNNLLQLTCHGIFVKKMILAVTKNHVMARQLAIKFHYTHVLIYGKMISYVICIALIYGKQQRKTPRTRSNSTIYLVSCCIFSLIFLPFILLLNKRELIKSAPSIFICLTTLFCLGLSEHSLLLPLSRLRVFGSQLINYCSSTKFTLH